MPKRKRKTAYCAEAQRGTIRPRVDREMAEAMAGYWECSPDEAVRRALRDAMRRMMLARHGAG